MHKLNKLSFLFVFVLIAIVIIQLLVPLNKVSNYVDLVIPGISTCNKDCLSVDVKTVYTGSDIEVSEDNVYGGNMSPQICSNVGESYICKELDISKISGYRIVNRVISGKSQSFANFVYINKFVENREAHKVYFLFRVLGDSISKWVYDDPLAVISYDVTTDAVTNEGQLNIVGLNVQDINVSPNGSYILVTDAFNPQYLPNTTTSSIVLFDLKNKKTKVLVSADSGGWLKFISWIDNNHFFYTENPFNSSSTLFKFKEII